MEGDWRQVLRVVAVLIWAALQYGLIVWTLRDLVGRPRVRGNNKVVWALIILTLPVVGALLYAAFGPVSALPSPSRVSKRPIDGSGSGSSSPPNPRR